MKFRKKPVVIEAMRFLGGLSFDEMTVEWGEVFTDVARYIPETNEIAIKTLESKKEDFYATYGDWIIRGVKGEFYACKPDIFEATYADAQEIICPFMSRPEGDRLCEREKCSAWGKWEEDGAYKDEIKREGCLLIRK